MTVDVTLNATLFTLLRSVNNEAEMQTFNVGMRLLPFAGLCIFL